MRKIICRGIFIFSICKLLKLTFPEEETYLFSYCYLSPEFRVFFSCFWMLFGGVLLFVCYMEYRLILAAGPQQDVYHSVFCCTDFFSWKWWAWNSPTGWDQSRRRAWSTPSFPWHPQKKEDWEGVFYWVKSWGDRRPPISAAGDRRNGKERGIERRVKEYLGECWWMSRQTEVGLENNHGPFFPVSCHTKRCAVG